MAHKTERFSVSFARDELNIINRFCQRTGVSRNEYLRRSALAVARCANADWQIGVKQAFEEIGVTANVKSLFRKGGSAAASTLSASNGLDEMEV